MAVQSGRTASDRCEPIREQIRSFETEVREIESDLDDPDVPEHVKEQLRILLNELNLRLRGLAEELRRCEALPEYPLRK